MPKNTEVDAYIASAPEYAKPILEKLRTMVHRAHPTIVETMKWSAPHFDHKGIVLGMAAFKNHVSWGFWKAKAMRDPENLFGGEPAASSFRIEARTVKDLPAAKVFTAYVKEAVALNDNGVKASPSGNKPRKPKPAPKVPADLAGALRANRKAKATYDDFSNSHKAEYVEWITEAKRAETRAKRLATAVEWMSEGKTRHWKHREKR
jgi:hypothetical protein